MRLFQKLYWYCEHLLLVGLFFKTKNLTVLEGVVFITKEVATVLLNNSYEELSNWLTLLS